MNWDEKDNWGKKKSERKDTHLQHLISGHVEFLFLFGKGSGVHDFTSLLGADKKKLLKNLPEKFDGVIQPKLLWEKFSIIYAIVTCTAPSSEMINGYFEKAQEWINLFLSPRAMGYKKANITPYMHAMMYHAPQFFEAFRTITGQGVERNNDIARTTVLHKLLKHESQLWELKEQERSKRVYTKARQ